VPDPIPAVLYAAKSTADPRGSIPTQLEDCGAAVEREGGRTVVGEFSDEGRSAYSGNRGPGLEAAKRAAAEAAAEHGTAELWVQHSDRIARGDGLGADHLAEVYFATRRQGVRLRSVQDDGNLEDAFRAVLIGERNREDSDRKSAATRAGKRRRAERGQLVGGPVPDGYVLRDRLEGDRAVRVYEVDPTRAPIIARIFELADAGVTPAAIARKLNAEGHRTPRRVTRTGRNAGREWGGKPWTRRRVFAALTCAAYAGLVTHGEDTFEGEHPALVDRETFECVARLLAARNPSPDRPATFRKAATRHLLAGLATCGECGETMFAITSGWRRADGSRARAYVCRNVHARAGTCAAPRVNAEVVEPVFVDHLRSFGLDFDGWLDAQRGHRAEERAAVEAGMALDREALATVERREGLVRADYLRQLEAAREAAAEVAAEAQAALATERRQLEHRIAEQETALEALSGEPPADRLLDLANDLSAAVRGLSSGDTVREVNERLRQAIDWVDRAGPGDGPQRGRDRHP